MIALNVTNHISFNAPEYREIRFKFINSLTVTYTFNMNMTIVEFIEDVKQKIRENYGFAHIEIVDDNTPFLGRIEYAAAIVPNNVSLKSRYINLEFVAFYIRVLVPTHALPPPPPSQIISAYIIDSLYEMNYENNISRYLTMIDFNNNNIEFENINPPVTAAAAAVEPIASQPDILTCIVCLEGTRTLLFSPCHHLCTCLACGSNEAITICPICRAPIDEKTRVFI